MRTAACGIAFLAMLTLSAWAQVEGSPGDEGASEGRREGTPPRLLHAEPANYPSDASLAGVRHTCVISVVIGRDGSLRSARLENTQPSPFDAAALQAVQRATFAPANLNGQAVGARTQVWVEFRGDGKAALPTLDPGPDFIRPKVKMHPFPEYTDAARRARIRGNVLLSFIVTEKGAVTDVEVLTHQGGGLDDEAIKTVQEWTFSPATLDGEAVPDRIKTAMSFNLR
jgi:TonB family protein